jgi:hypothetical protein
MDLAALFTDAGALLEFGAPDQLLGKVKLLVSPRLIAVGHYVTAAVTSVRRRTGHDLIDLLRWKQLAGLAFMAGLAARLSLALRLASSLGARWIAGRRLRRIGRVRPQLLLKILDTGAELGVLLPELGVLLLKRLYPGGDLRDDAVEFFRSA